jgi:TonB family protein
MRFAGRLLALFLASVSPAAVFAQSQPSGAQPAPLPKSPAQFMQLAWQQNGLHGDNLKPWHVRATWQVLDNKGQPQKQGVWEEWWVSPHEWKTFTNSPEGQETVWGSVQGVYSVGHGSLDWFEDLAEKMILQPASTERPLDKLRFRAYDVRNHKVKLHCVRVNETAEEFCFDQGLPDLRTKTTPILQFAMNSMVQFQGRYVARDIYVARQDMPAIQIHIDELDSTTDESQIAPPPQARFVPPAPVLPGAVTAGRRISGDVPEYPFTAKQAHIQGTVALWAEIGKDGTIHHLEVISGPSTLQQSALDAVKTWRYIPYLLNGEPVEVETQVNVVYELGGGAVTDFLRP